MEQYIALDAHKRYSYASVETTDGRIVKEQRIEHCRGAIAAFLETCEDGCSVAVETVGSWYWIVDEIEEAGMEPRLVHARKAKLMLAATKKTDKLNARGMNRLQRVVTLPTVWIPGQELRDMRDLYRTRMMLAQERTRIKNLIHSALDKYGIHIEGTSDIFNQKGRSSIEAALEQLPPYTRFSTTELLDQLDSTEARIKKFEQAILEAGKDSSDVQLLRTIPGVGKILSFVIANEIGDVNRFPRAASLAAYSGTTPRVHSSGGKTRFTRAPADVNRYLKWAFTEAANVIVLNQHKLSHPHVVHRYKRVRAKKGHSVAVGAMARHLAEASYWILVKREPYMDPEEKRTISSTKR